MRKLPLALLGVTVLSACGGGEDTSPRPTTIGNVIVSDPIISAGSDAAYTEGTSVTLLASLFDSDEISTLTWTQLSGTPVTLSDINALSPSFTAPLVTADSELVFRLTASPLF